MVHPPAIPSAFTSHALQLLQQVQRGISPIELVYTTHECWPFLPDELPAIRTRPPLRISVLDSSFNPPTLAHLALANSLQPLSYQRLPTSHPSLEAYDARLLLLSVRNADKSLKPGDATFLQRLEMMRLLSDDMGSSHLAESGGEFSQARDNVAVAIIDEPMFVRKSTLLLRFLRAKLAAVVRSSDSLNRCVSISESGQDASHQFPSPELTFLMGSDTLIRLVSHKYYPSEQAMVQMLRKFLSPDEGESRIVCANRGTTNLNAVNLDKAQSEVAHEFVQSDRITFIDIGAEEQTYSSTEVRAKVAAKDGSWVRLVTDAIASYIIAQETYLGQGNNEGIYSSNIQFHTGQRV